MGKTIAVVTGASSGFGREFVKLLLREPGIEEIWAVARRREKLDRLRADFGDKIRIFPLDLSDAGAIRQFQTVLAKERPRIACLVNSAGYGKFCPSADLGIEASANMVALNCTGVVAMGLACLPYLPGGGRILNIASQASFQPLPHLNLYSATKAFVRNYSRALNVELRDRRITVTAVCPGWMDTAFFDRAEVGARKAVHNFTAMASPDRVAAKALRDAKLGRDMSVCGLYVKAAHLAAKLLPQRAMMKLWLIQQGL